MGNEGKKVRVHYTGTLDDGSKFDSSHDRGEPLAFTCMAGQMIKGFDLAVRDMSVGDVVDVRLEPDEAYGPRRDELVPWRRSPVRRSSRSGRTSCSAPPPASPSRPWSPPRTRVT